MATFIAAWMPSASGKLFTHSPDWVFALQRDDKFALTIDNVTRTRDLHEITEIDLKRGLFWSSITFGIEGEQQRVVDGIGNNDALMMVRRTQRAINDCIASATEKLLPELDQVVVSIEQWFSDLKGGAATEFQNIGWLCEAFGRKLAGEKPESALSWLMDKKAFDGHLNGYSQETRATLKFWKGSLKKWVDQSNQEHVAAELLQSKDFFARIEKSPLSEEQARAVICFDKRVLVVAAAGSGKTSAMVAKAGYAVKQGLISPENILLLAFNTDAAQELETRVKSRLKQFSIDAAAIQVSTFHAFGLSVIGQVTSQKPHLAGWIERGEVLRELLNIIEQLRLEQPGFWMNWELFRLVLSNDLPKFGEKEAPEDWDSRTKVSGFKTLQGEVVRSKGEQIIANWLFFHGIEYLYETAYEHKTADAEHSQYHPDFYFPAIKTYYEHWALDARGYPPPSFEGYAAGMLWKKDLHALHGTSLIETTTAQLYSGEAFDILERELKARGLVPKLEHAPVPAGRNPLENAQLLRVMQSFLTHVKSNRFTAEDLRERLERGVVGHFRFRHQLFLKLFEAIRQEWDLRLQKENAVDFEDMLNLAANHIESGAWNNPYELVCVDEFQDSSLARARIVRALSKKESVRLFAVGDDWQSINRFAGSDLSVMVDFQKWFGNHTLCRLQTTYRCPQDLCDISSRFVQRNPLQIAKTVVSASKAPGFGIRIRTADREADIQGIIRSYAVHLNTRNAAEGNASPTNVMVLGRYKQDEGCMPACFDLTGVDVSFRTIHKSKGLECDYVVLPRLVRGGYAFPSQIQDDPVLKLAMPEPEEFEFAEERRLLYVALTRARKGVLIVTVKDRESPFISELGKQPLASASAIDYKAGANRKVCPECKVGFMTQRTSEHGQFWGCSTFPACKHTERGENQAAYHGGKNSKRKFRDRK